MHIEIDFRLFYREINFDLSEDLFFEGDGIDNEIKIDMVSEVFEKTEIESPCAFESELVEREVNFFDGWI